MAHYSKDLKKKKSQNKEAELRAEKENANSLVRENISNDISPLRGILRARKA